MQLVLDEDVGMLPESTGQKPHRSRDRRHVAVEQLGEIRSRQTAAVRVELLRPLGKLGEAETRLSLEPGRLLGERQQAHVWIRLRLHKCNLPAAQTIMSVLGLACKTALSARSAVTLAFLNPQFSEFEPGRPIIALLANPTAREMFRMLLKGLPVQLARHLLNSGVPRSEIYALGHPETVRVLIERALTARLVAQPDGSRGDVHLASIEVIEILDLAETMVGGVRIFTAYEKPGTLEVAVRVLAGHTRRRDLTEDLRVRNSTISEALGFMSAVGFLEARRGFSVRFVPGEDEKHRELLGRIYALAESIHYAMAQNAQWTLSHIVGEQIASMDDRPLRRPGQIDYMPPAWRAELRDALARRSTDDPTRPAQELPDWDWRW
jgi:hypothetical protein